MFAASLPDLDSLDLEAAKALLIAQHQSYTATLSSRSTEVERLMLLVEKLQRMLFGRKSEKVLRQIEQLELQLEELQAANAIEEHAAAASVARPIAAKRFRRPLPEHLPHEIHTDVPDHEACPDCGGRLRVLGEDTAEMLEHVRACFKVIRHVRPKMSCDACDRIVQAPAPSRPIDRGLAGPGLLAHVLVSKYADHVPLYRQSEIYSREGLDLDRSTLAGLVGATSELLAPLVEAVRTHVMSASKLHADDTPVPVLAPGNGRTKTGRLWTYVRDDQPSGDTSAPAVWFAYSPDRRGENPRQHLKHYKGALQADAFAGFQQLYEGGTINEVACWAHARRKFHEIHIAHASPTTAEAIERIAALYAIEAQIRGSTPEVRRSVRQARAKPLLDSMRIWMEDTLAKLSRKSDTAAAIRYATSRWLALTRYVDDGHLEIDNNAAERALRVVALGRKNYLFCGSNAAENAPLPSTRYSDQPSSTVSTRNSISIKCSNASQTTPSAESLICCHGTSPSPGQRTHLNRCPPIFRWTLTTASSSQGRFTPRAYARTALVVFCGPGLSNYGRGQIAGGCGGIMGFPARDRGTAICTGI